MRTSAIFFLAVCSSASAFTPTSVPIRTTANTHSQLHAETSRRQAMGAIVGAAALGAAGLFFPQASDALENPALKTLKSRKPTKQAFIPGKGLRNNEEYESLVALENPALKTFQGRKTTKGQFIPGKGLRNVSGDFDSLVALENPALKTFQGRKTTKGQFIPGKGLRNISGDFDSLVALDNPALKTFKGRTRTKGAFIPGKGLRNNEEFFV